MKYFWLSCGEDGDYRFSICDEDDVLTSLQERINDGDMEDPSEKFYSAEEVAQLPWGGDPNYWRKAILIKGEIIVPKAKEVVKRVELAP